MNTKIERARKRRDDAQEALDMIAAQVQEVCPHKYVIEMEPGRCFGELISPARRICMECGYEEGAVCFGGLSWRREGYRDSLLGNHRDRYIVPHEDGTPGRNFYEFRV